MSNGILILAALVFLAALAIVTTVLRWTFRVNEKFDQNKEIIRLLKKIAGEKQEN